MAAKRRILGSQSILGNCLSARHRNDVSSEEATEKMSQRYFCPAEYSTKTKPKTNPKKLSLGLVLGFVCTPLGKNIFGSFSFI